MASDRERQLAQSRNLDAINANIAVQAQVVQKRNNVLALRLEASRQLQQGGGDRAGRGHGHRLHSSPGLTRPRSSWKTLSSVWGCSA
jgi:hypothetical protein